MTAGGAPCDGDDHGLDLIQEQIRAAQGEVLRFKQEDIQIKVQGYSRSATLPEDVPPGYCQALAVDLAV